MCRRGVGGKNPFSLQYLISQNISKYYILIPFSLPRPVESATGDPACHYGGLSESRSGDRRTRSRFHFGDSGYPCAGAVFKAATGGAAGLAVPCAVEWEREPKRCRQTYGSGREIGTSR